MRRSTCSVVEVAIIKQKRNYTLKFLFALARAIPITTAHISTTMLISTPILSLYPSPFLDICSFFF
jgi:hypothetical protein